MIGTITKKENKLNSTHSIISVFITRLKYIISRSYYVNIFPVKDRF